MTVEKIELATPRPQQEQQEQQSLAVPVTSDKAASEPPAPGPTDDDSAQDTPLLQQSNTFPSTAMSTTTALAKAQEYKLKDIQFRDPSTSRLRDIKIVTQNENGPCPLLALTNVLVLRGDLSIAGDRKTISDIELISMLGDLLFRESVPDDDDVGAEGRRNDGLLRSDDVQVILRLLPTLNTGLDVDLQFSHIYDFASSPATQLFKAFNVDLVHGWVVDPESERGIANVLMHECRNSYEGAVEFIVAGDELSKGSVVEQQSDQIRRRSTAHHQEDMLTEREQTIVHNALAVNQWLEKTATQLTDFGLQSLGTLLPNNHLAVLFRNNHFSTVFKRARGELFLLCTDDAMAGDERVVWESLRDVHQMTSEFLDSQFSRMGNHSDTSQASGSSQQQAGNNRYGKQAADFVHEDVTTTTDAKQLDEDFAFALSLQEEDDRQHHQMREKQKLQLRQQDNLPPGLDVKQSGHLYGVPVVTKESERKLAQTIFRTKSDENFSRRMADTFLPHEAAAKKAKAADQDKCTIM
ncbi:hypothetical protein FBU59_004609 [Linderina macrospora]|uniref:Uncharacterized protein n=1 Tax=Linderina macrospora TaxID=4868 RepID=A0ACC1J513_9FUNG|nr:hypothetical protein FBU59_004609 [Linderina macrospora]